jgi:hypothetical protein
MLSNVFNAVTATTAAFLLGNTFLLPSIFTQLLDPVPHPKLALPPTYSASASAPSVIQRLFSKVQKYTTDKTCLASHHKKKRKTIKLSSADKVLAAAKKKTEQLKYMLGSGSRMMISRLRR